MDQRIVYLNESGGLSILIPALSDGVTIEDIAAKDVPEGIASHIVDVSDIPKDRTFRNAWRMEGQAVRIDIIKAKEIAHDVRRSARDVEMRPLDILATIPSKAVDAEKARRVVRVECRLRQAAIDKALSSADLLSALES